MTNIMKKLEFLQPLPRLFAPGGDPYGEILFQPAEMIGDEAAPALTAPVEWNNEAVSVMQIAAAASVPAELRTTEENTVPSWLWRHSAKGARKANENDLRDIFDRVVGSAAAKAWQLNLFTSEKQARGFYDEARAAFMQRVIAIAPEILAGWGLDWAYGMTSETAAAPKLRREASLSNADIENKTGAWKNLFAAGEIVHLRLSDIAQDWHSAAPTPARACIDLMALRHNDGSVNIEALRQAARLLTVLLDLQDRDDVTIGLANLAPLLMALGLSYDSDAARALAASIAALVTAECITASAEMSSLRGASDTFNEEHEAIMRGLRNHRRAAYGDGNDYEKLSVLPAPLPLKNCPDLALLAEAQRGWDVAVRSARAYGLRQTQPTDLTPSPILGILLSDTTQGLEPMPALSRMIQDDAGLYRAETHPALFEALTRMKYGRHDAAEAARYITGSHSLRKTPAINKTSLHAKGLDDAALEKIEAYIPFVNTLRLAVTPWIIGIDFCQRVLKISARKLDQASFDLLAHLGFSDADVKSADLACYGHGTARKIRAIHLRHRAVFARGEEVSVIARIRMAASVQSFISGDTGIAAGLPANHGVDMVLEAWRCGLKSLTLRLAPVEAKRKATARKIKAKSQSHAKPMGSIKRLSKAKKIAPPPSRKHSEKRLRSR
jgi:hypothetical protein